MYDRAPRPLTQPSTSTPPALGPGVYHSGKCSTNAAFAPFSSLSKRPSFVTMSEQMLGTPGPGHYQLDSPQSSKIKGGESLQRKSLRFLTSLPHTPGPGAYNVTWPTAWNRTYVDSTAEYNKELMKGRNALCNGRVVFQRQATAPSIPIPGLNCGYEQTASGQLNPQKLPDRDNTIGPAYYNLFQDESTTGVKYKGINFGSLKSCRVSFTGKEGPGPGDYDPQSFHHNASITSQSGPANLPRYHELIPYEESKKNIPGPGKYHLPSQFRSDEVEIDGAAKPAFGSSLKRFLSVVTCSPPCTKYSDPRSGFSCLTRIAGLSGSPFGQTASRFKDSRLALESPGPGSYNNSDATSMSTRALHKSVLVGVMHPVFGSSSMRTAPLAKMGSQNYPGPSDYYVDLRPPRFVKPTAAFASSTERFYTPRSTNVDFPPPIFFKGFDPHLKSQYENKAYLSPASARITLPRDTFLMQGDIKNPGPGHYDPAKLHSIGMQRQGQKFARDERFKLHQKTNLGPGTYEMSKAVMNTVLSGTHNVTLCNPLVEEEEKPPGVVSRKLLLANNKDVLLTA